MLTSLLTR